MLHRAPYSPDLIDSDYFLFPKQKMKLKGNHFIKIVTIKEAETRKSKSVPETDFSWAMNKLEDHARSCIVFNGVKVH